MLKLVPEAKLAHSTIFKSGDFLRVLNQEGKTVGFGSLISEDKDYVCLRQVVAADRSPCWRFGVGQYPKLQLVIVRPTRMKGDLPLLTSAMHELDLVEQAFVDIERRRMLDARWRPLRVSGNSMEWYERIRSSAIYRLLMSKDVPQEILIARVMRGRWHIEKRERFLAELERMRSPHLNLMREVLSAKKLKHVGVHKPPKFIGL